MTKIRVLFYIALLYVRKLLYPLIAWCCLNIWIYNGRGTIFNDQAQDVTIPFVQLYYWRNLLSLGNNDQIDMKKMMKTLGTTSVTIVHEKDIRAYRQDDYQIIVQDSYGNVLHEYDTSDIPFSLC